MATCKSAEVNANVRNALENLNIHITSYDVIRQSSEGLVPASAVATTAQSIMDAILENAYIISTELDHETVPDLTFALNDADAFEVPDTETFDAVRSAAIVVLKAFNRR